MASLAVVDRIDSKNKANERQRRCQANLEDLVEPDPEIVLSAESADQDGGGGFCSQYA